MKTVIGKQWLALAGALAIGSFSSAHADGTSIGNGGHVVACERGGRTSYELLDRYEARILRGLSIGAQGATWQEMALDQLVAMERLAPGKARAYAERVQTFMDNVVFLENEDLPLIPDAEEFVLPVGCALKQVAVNRSLQRYDLEKPYYIDKRIWNELSPLDQAMLVLHEIEYTESAWHQSQIPDHRTTSRGLRYFNGILFSPVIHTLTPQAFYAVLGDAYLNTSDYSLRTFGVIQDGLVEGMRESARMSFGNHPFALNDQNYGDRVRYVVKQTQESYSDARGQSVVGFHGHATRRLYVSSGGPNSIGWSNVGLKLDRVELPWVTPEIGTVTQVANPSEMGMFCRSSVEGVMVKDFLEGMVEAANRTDAAGSPCNGYLMRNGNDSDMNVAKVSLRSSYLASLGINISGQDVVEADCSYLSGGANPLEAWSPVRVQRYKHFSLTCSAALSNATLTRAGAFHRVPINQLSFSLDGTHFEVRIPEYHSARRGRDCDIVNVPVRFTAGGALHLPTGLDQCDQGISNSQKPFPYSVYE